MISIDPHIFRAYDIRGTALKQVTEKACEAIGRAFGSELCERYNSTMPTVVIGRDARSHSLQLEEATIRGLKKAGCSVLRIGQTPSPLNYFIICEKNLDGGVQITASHNGPQDNGLKLQIREAEAFSGEELQRLRARIEEERFVKDATQSQEETIDAITPYISRLEKLFPNAGDGIRVVIDTGNGVAGPTYCEAFRRVGCDVIELYTDPDGSFPNHLADPSNWETMRELQQKVQEKHAHFGMAFDGDGDRLGMIDEQGAIRTADEILLLLVQDYLSRHPGAPIVFTVSNSGALDSEIRAWGGKPIMCKVGHSFVEHAMREHNALLGGEQSGHFFCGEDYYGYDDALVAALRVLHIAAKANRSFSNLFKDFPKVYQTPELRPHCPDAKKDEIITQIVQHFQSAGYPVNTMDGGRIDFGDGAWAGIRQSNTSPKLSICIEARSEKKRDDVQKLIMDHLQSYDEIVF